MPSEDFKAGYSMGFQAAKDLLETEINRLTEEKAALQEAFERERAANIRQGELTGALQQELRTVQDENEGEYERLETKAEEMQKDLDAAARVLNRMLPDTVRVQEVQKAYNHLYEEYQALQKDTLGKQAQAAGIALEAAADHFDQHRQDCLKVGYMDWVVDDVIGELRRMAVTARQTLGDNPDEPV